jgi:hypothetical protein
MRRLLGRRGFSVDFSGRRSSCRNSRGIPRTSVLAQEKLVSTASARRFTLFDAMVLLGAVALGFALARPPYTFVRSLARTVPRLTLIAQWSTVAVPLNATLTISTLILSLKFPRSSLRRSSRQPGIAACAVGTVALTLSALLLIPDVLRAINGPYFRPMLINLWLFSSQWTGIAILSSWIALSLSGRWRSEQNWIDRSGRVLGCCWICSYAFAVAFHWAQLL